MNRANNVELWPIVLHESSRDPCTDNGYDRLEPAGYRIVMLKDGLKMAYDDSLRGYAFPVHKRDGFKCRYCGMDGTGSFDDWLRLSWDHLLPKDHEKRDDHDFIVTACMFCNTADNQYFRHAEKRGLRFDGMTPDELVEQRKPYVMKTRQSYREFWDEFVQPKGSGIQQ